MTAQPSPGRPLVTGARVLLASCAVLTLLATDQLFVRADGAEQGFAWTMAPTLTAAVSGGGFATGCVLVLHSLGRGTWATARVGSLTVLLLTLVALTAALLHLEALDDVRALRPWALTELAEHAVASWLVALGVGAVLAVVEDSAWVDLLAVVGTLCVGVAGIVRARSRLPSAHACASVRSRGPELVGRAR